MKKLLQYYTVITVILCCIILGAAAMVTVNETSSAMTFGTQSEKIQLSADTFGSELQKLFTWIFSFLPFRE